MPRTSASAPVMHDLRAKEIACVCKRDMGVDTCIKNTIFLRVLGIDSNVEGAASMANELSPQALQQLRQHLDAALVHPMPAAAPAPARAAAAAAPANFCSIWPTAKPILQGIAGIIILFPGFGATASTALNALLSVGDQVFNSTCKTT